VLTSPCTLCTGTQARPPRGGDEAGVLQLHGRVEVMVADMGLVICAQWQWGVQPHDIPCDEWAQEARGAQLQEPHGGHHDVLYSYRDMNLIQNIEL